MSRDQLLDDPNESLKADFELAAGDLVALTMAHNRRSPAMRRQRYGYLLGGFAVLSALPALTLLTSDEPAVETAAAIWPLLLGPVLFVLFFTPYLRWKSRRAIKRLFAEGQNTGRYGACSLAITPDGLREIQASGETRRSWNAVERLLIADDHAFIFTSAVEAFVLPRRAFATRERFQAFVNEIEKRASVTREAA
jgi:hypothetical protein